MEQLLVFVILGLCIAFTAWRVYGMFTRKGSPCAGCNGCPLSNQMCEKCEKEHCTHKK